MLTSPAQLQHTLESICNEGCKAVRHYIQLLEQGYVFPALQPLSSAEREWILRELKAIMAVYNRN
ncbi:MAG: hypothetical protein HY080_13900 [Gammaproteobacteria bacterium]|nr:hypothetical protein [Gammaproteobacteria bacterium]